MARRLVDVDGFVDQAGIGRGEVRIAVADERPHGAVARCIGDLELWMTTEQTQELGSGVPRRAKNRHLCHRITIRTHAQLTQVACVVMQFG